MFVHKVPPSFVALGHTFHELRLQNLVLKLAWVRCYWTRHEPGEFSLHVHLLKRSFELGILLLSDFFAFLGFLLRRDVTSLSASRSRNPDLVVVVLSLLGILKGVVCFAELLEVVLVDALVHIWVVLLGQLKVLQLQVLL